MMEPLEKIIIKEAIHYLKAGYQLKAIIDKKVVHFLYQNERFLIMDGESFLKLDEYKFYDIYQNAIFEIEENQDEETVDIEKDREYYSWKQ